LVVSAIGAWRCAPVSVPASPSQPRRNLLLVTLDTVRADHLGSYGDRGAATPALDRLAREGVRFTAAQTAAPLTLPAHSTILSGLLPLHHGVHTNGLGGFPADRPTLATELASGGYATGAFVGAYVLDRRFGLARGFEVYDDEIPHGPEGPALEAERPGAAVVDRALAWLAKESTAPFFAWVHLYDAHFPYAPPEPYRGRFAAAPYDGEGAAVDAQVGRLLDFLASSGRDRDTVVVVAADHGEALGEHGERAHGLLLYESTLRVPLLLREPGALPAGRVVNEPVGLVDLAPTVLDLLALPVPAGLDGRNLAPALRAGREPEPAALYAETEYPASFGWAPLHALRQGEWKLVRGVASELYDLAADPAEACDLAQRETARRSALERPLVALQRDAPPVGAPSGSPDAESRARLASLGYLAVAPSSVASTTDPRQRLEVFAAFEEAGWERAGGRAAAAIEKLRRAVAADPQNPVFRGALAQAERDSGHWETAIAEYRAAIRLAPLDAGLRLDLATALHDRGALAEGEAAAAEAARLDPRSSDALILLGICAAERGDREGARQRFERATQLEPRSATAWNDLGNAWRALGRGGEAAAAFAEAAALAPRWADPLNGLGVIEVESGRAAQAIAYFDRALELEPQFTEARRNRALALERR
jgi:arylsulfatase A-like enzyme/Tfp pilus assembly protein PilF